jgi:hypothetical protein
MVNPLSTPNWRSEQRRDPLALVEDNFERMFDHSNRLLPSRTSALFGFIQEAHWSCAAFRLPFAAILSVRERRARLAISSGRQATVKSK